MVAPQGERERESFLFPDVDRKKRSRRIGRQSRRTDDSQAAKTDSKNKACCCGRREERERGRKILQPREQQWDTAIEVVVTEMIDRKISSAAKEIETTRGVNRYRKRCRYFESLSWRGRRWRRF